jgi:phenylacetic acid degradation operon negative regulatory protein
MPMPLDLSSEDGTGIPTRLLVLGLTDRRGTVRMPDLLRVGEACGLGAEQIRSCMRRLVNEGLFRRSENVSTESEYVATELGRIVIDSNLQRSLLAYAQDAAGRGWDRNWHLIAFAIPEPERTARDQLREHIRRLGGAQIQKGLYVSPHRWEPEVAKEVDLLGLGSYVTTAATDSLSVKGHSDPRDIARSLWPLDELSASYSRFVEQYQHVPEYLESLLQSRSRLSDSDWLPGVLHIAVRFSESFNEDPLLPPELLPRPWPGRQARELLARCRKMGVLTRADPSAPSFFRLFDDAIAHLP